MSTLTRWLDAKLYPDCERNWDDALFRAAILRHLGSEHMILDLGAGAGLSARLGLRAPGEQDS